MTLLKLGEKMIVHPEEIAKAWRCGNYTEVWLKGASHWQSMQIWDQDETLWRAIQEVAKP